MYGSVTADVAKFSIGIHCGCALSMVLNTTAVTVNCAAL